VRYRPTHDLTVRYSASVQWGADAATNDTIMASVTNGDPLPGTLVATAEHDGRALQVSIWRWPFDPELVGLADTVVPSSVDALFDIDHAGPCRPTVKAFRPTERAVVHVVDAFGRELYLKVVPPATAEALAARHRILRACGVPAPKVHRVFPDRGIVAMEALRGCTLRDLLKSGHGRWPDADDYLELAESLSSVDPPADRTSGGSRASDAEHHGAMLATVLPSERDRIERILNALGDLAKRSDARATATIHGDLYEAQLIVEDGRITGVLDLDDVRRGDRYDDLANVIGHLLVRALDAAHRHAIGRYAARLRDGFSTTVDRRELDLTTAAVVVGLATGPFRVQQHDWELATRRHLWLAEQLVTGACYRDLQVA
jgi:tRNA A-37 threonylcarbamoyl transferase component Bud32